MNGSKPRLWPGLALWVRVYAVERRHRRHNGPTRVHGAIASAVPAGAATASQEAQGQAKPASLPVACFWRVQAGTGEGGRGELSERDADGRQSAAGDA